MPIYEYECQTCHFKFDKIQKFSDKPLTQCPKCSEATLKKLISSSAFHLKGDGWYASGNKVNKQQGTENACAEGSPCQHCPNLPTSN